MLHCNPPHAEWDPAAGLYPTAANTDFGCFTGAWNAASDVAFALYPIFLFWSLQLSKKLKLGLCVLMRTGVFVVACSAVKTWEVHLNANTKDPTREFSLSNIRIPTVVGALIDR